MLPGSLMESNAALLRDDVLCNVLGSHIIENLTRIAEMETDSFRLAVHPWELDRYLATY
jgi:glutamine synthetase